MNTFCYSLAKNCLNNQKLCPTKNETAVLKNIIYKQGKIEFNFIELLESKVGLSETNALAPNN